MQVLILMAVLLISIPVVATIDTAAIIIIVLECDVKFNIIV